MNWDSPTHRRLLAAFLALKSDAEAQRFLRDLMTEKEITEFAKRLETAELLTQKVPYVVIEQQTGLSSATVARVAKWLHGPEGGYRAILAKLHHAPTIRPRRGVS